MGLFKNIKGLIYKADFFYTTELLRYKQETQYKTLFGGVLSLIIIICLLVLFYSMLIDTMNKVLITSNAYNVNSADPTPYTISTFPDSKFMFGVEVWHHDLNTGLRYFDVQMVNVELDSGVRRSSSKQYPLQPCKQQHWQDFPDISAKYNSLNMSYWLCLPKNTTYQIQGKYSSSFTKLLKIDVKKCKNSTKYQRPCAPQSQIDRYLDQMGSLAFSVYFINPLINPSNQQYLSYYLEDTNYIDFTKTFGGESLLFIEDFTITTDQSILPFVQEKVDTGGVISQFALKSPFLITTSTYCSFAFFKSGNSKFYERKFQKLDSLLAYIGGLFGTIAIFLFLVNTYNGHSFEVTLGGYLFQKNPQEIGKRPKHYHFITFLFHQIYSFLDSIGCAPNWKYIRQFDQRRSQMVKQLDILYLLERVSFLQKTIKILLDENQLKGLHFHQKITLLEAKRHRKNYKLSRKVSKLKQEEKCKQKSKNVTQNDEMNQSMNYLHQKKITNENIQLFNIEENLQVIDPTGKRNLSSISKENDSNQRNNNLYPCQSQSSEQSQNENEQNWIQQILILRKQAQAGQKLSKKIWEQIHPLLKQKLSLISQKYHVKKSSEKLSFEPKPQQKLNDLLVASPIKIIPKPRRLSKIKTQISQQKQI